MPSDLTIYVLPTEKGRPPTALVGMAVDTPEGEGVAGVMAIWNADSGFWAIDGQQVDEQLGEAISGHAGDLGVEGF